MKKCPYIDLQWPRNKPVNYPCAVNCSLNSSEGLLKMATTGHDVNEKRITIPISRVPWFSPRLSPTPFYPSSSHTVISSLKNVDKSYPHMPSSILGRWIKRLLGGCYLIIGWGRPLMVHVRKIVDDFAFVDTWRDKDIISNSFFALTFQNEYFPILFWFNNLNLSSKNIQFHICFHHLMGELSRIHLSTI